MLTLGMCASVAIFAFVDAALLKPLPYQNSSRLVGVFESNAMFPLSNLSYFDYLDWKKRRQHFQLARCVSAKRLFGEHSGRRPKSARRSRE